MVKDVRCRFVAVDWSLFDGGDFGVAGSSGRFVPLWVVAPGGAGGGAGGGGGGGCVGSGEFLQAAFHASGS